MTTACRQPRSDGDARFGGLLPDRILVHRAPRWWQEIALVAICYWIYTISRNAIHSQKRVADLHARSVQHVQDLLHVNIEQPLNAFVARTGWLAQIMNYYYATLHFIVTIGVLIWLYRRRPRIYRGARTVLFATSLFGLLGFYLYPLTPPRLLPQFGYIDTVEKFHTWGSFANPEIAAHSNQFAAMPSLHIGWALWCATCVALSTKRGWVQVLAMLYPLCTLLVILGTANHFLLDAVGGLAAFGAGLAAQLASSGHGALSEAPLPERVRVRHLIG